jgi:hypothetical protein
MNLQEKIKILKRLKEERDLIEQENKPKWTLICEQLGKTRWKLQKNNLNQSSNL